MTLQHSPIPMEQYWARLTERLTECLRDLEEDDFLIIAHKRKNYYVQFAEQGHFGLLMEASCNLFIEPEHLLTEAQYERAMSLGWQRATGELDEDGDMDDPDDSPNFHLSVAAEADRADAARLAVDTLQQVFEIDSVGDLGYKAFTMGNDRIRFPSLGLKRVIL